MDNPQTIIVKQQKPPGLIESCCALTCCSWVAIFVGMLAIGGVSSLF